MAGAIHDMERRLAESNPHAGPNVKTDDFKQQPPSVKPAGKRRRTSPAPRKTVEDTKTAAETPSQQAEETRRPHVGRPFCIIPKPTWQELAHAALPQLLQATGLLILIIVSLLARQTALAVICLLGLLAFVGWRLATYDWTPMETVRRTIEHGYGVAVVRLLNADDMNQPVRVITDGGQYVAWYTDGRESRVHAAILIVNKGRIALTTPDMGILPTLGETI